MEAVYLETSVFGYLASRVSSDLVTAGNQRLTMNWWDNHRRPSFARRRSLSMYDDPIVADIRRLRDEYAQRFGYDLEAICRDLREQQQRGGRRVVKRQPKRPSGQHAISQPKVTEQSDPPEPRSGGIANG